MFNENLFLLLELDFIRDTNEIRRFTIIPRDVYAGERFVLDKVFNNNGILE